MARPIVFADIESTGVDRDNDRIVELCLIKVDTESNTREIKTKRFNPEMPIPIGASEVHGIYDEDVKDAPLFKQYAKGILSFIDGCDLAGFNSNAFDFPMLYMEFYRAGINWEYSNHNFIDVGNLFKLLYPRTLSAAVKMFLGVEHDGAHGAEADTIATINVFNEIISRHKEELKDVADLSLYTNYDKKMLDLHGCFVYAEDGETILFNFGKHKGEPALNHISFLNWMTTKASFSPDVNSIVYKLLSFD